MRGASSQRAAFSCRRRPLPSIQRFSCKRNRSSGSWTITTVSNLLPVSFSLNFSGNFLFKEKQKRRKKCTNSSTKSKVNIDTLYSCIMRIWEIDVEEPIERGNSVEIVRVLKRCIHFPWTGRTLAYTSGHTPNVETTSSKWSSRV